MHNKVMNQQSSNDLLGKQQKQKKTVNIGEIKKAIAYSEQYIKSKGLAQHSVILFGNTGSGKSASITILNGQQMFGFKSEGYAVISNFQRQADRLASKKKNEGKEGIVFIESGVVSGTAHPAHLKMEGEHVIESVEMWDTPGTGDTKGITQILINTYFIRRLFNIMPTVKLFYTISYIDLKLDHKGKEFAPIAKSLTHALAKFTDYQQCTGLLITKVPLATNESEMPKLLLQNIKHLTHLESDKDIKKFFNNIKEGKMKIVVVHQPNVTGANTPQYPKNVTNQYQHFRHNFYNVVTKDLKAAKVPSLQAPGMSETQIFKCEQFLQRTVADIKQETNNLAGKIVAYIRNKLRIGNFQLNKQRNKDIIFNIEYIKMFILVVKQISTRQLSSVDELNKNFDALTATFESNGHKFQCEIVDKVPVCLPMKKIKDLNIIVDFLSGVNLSSNARFSCSDSLKYFFTTVGEKIIQVSNEADKELLDIDAKFFKNMVDKLARHHAQWRSEEIFKLWTKNLKVVPGLYLRAGKFNKNPNFTDYLNELQKMELETKLKCREDLNPIAEMYKYSKEVGQLYIDEASFTAEIKAMCSAQQQKVKAFLAEMWTKKNSTALLLPAASVNTSVLPASPNPKQNLVCPCCSTM